MPKDNLEFLEYSEVLNDFTEMVSKYSEYKDISKNLKFLWHNYDGRTDCKLVLQLNISNPLTGEVLSLQKEDAIALRDFLLKVFPIESKVKTKKK